MAPCAWCFFKVAWTLLSWRSFSRASTCLVSSLLTSFSRAKLHLGAGEHVLGADQLGLHGRHSALIGLVGLQHFEALGHVSVGLLLLLQCGACLVSFLVLVTWRSCSSAWLAVSPLGFGLSLPPILASMSSSSLSE